MARKKASESEVVLSAGSGAAATRRKTTTTAKRKKLPVKAVEAVELSVTEPVVSTGISATAALKPAPTYTEIAARAYLIWQSRGCQGGSPEQDWLEAERQLRAR